MARIYVSSTYEDLKVFREAVYGVLRKLKHDVVAMEDYVAADTRPLQKCLSDVASCDVYVGLIGFRYGYIPDQDNPDGKSITELEYRAAEKQGKPRLIFVYKGLADPNSADVFTGAGDSGRFVKGFKDELQKRHMVSEFATADELGQNVAVAVTDAIRERESEQKNGSQAAPVEQPDLDFLRDSARRILKLYSAKSIHDILHEIYGKAGVLRADDPAKIDGRAISNLASDCESKLISIAAEVAQCNSYLDDSERTRIEQHRPKLESGIARLYQAADRSDGKERANAVDAFNTSLDNWLTDLNNLLKGLADRLDGDCDEIRAAIGRLKERYALEPVERNLLALMADGNPVLRKCKQLVEEHHGLQDFHDKIPGLFDLLTTNDGEDFPRGWRTIKRSLSSARKAWEKFGQLPTGEEDWEENVRVDGQETWPLADTCIKDVDGIFAPEAAAADAVSKAVRPLVKLQKRVEEHFKVVDEALREGYRLVKVRVGEPIMLIR